jgi:CheY-like chemotaxis protein
MPLAAPVTAAALPDIAVMSGSSLQVRTGGGFRNFRKLELNNTAFRALTSTTRQNGHRQTGANLEEAYMGQSKPLRATALIVEDDPMQRDMICLLLEESEVDVIECESAEAAELVLERAAGSLVLMMTDVQLAGNMDGVELAHIARKYNPDMGVIVTSGKPLHQELPDGVQFWSKPWAPLDVIREAERMVYERSHHGEVRPRS